VIRRHGIVAALIAGLTLAAVSAVGAHNDDRDEIEVKVAVLANGHCGRFEGSLPTLVSRAAIRPGETVGDVAVCVQNDGDDTVALSLRVAELTDLDPACSGTEPTRDSSCGAGRRGELSPSLLQQVGLGACPSAPGINPTLDRRLTTLQASSLELADRLRRKQVVCVRLRLRYEPLDSDGGIASQSDRTTWRYAFTATARR
jgi:hypothetical protein